MPRLNRRRGEANLLEVDLLRQHALFQNQLDSVDLFQVETRFAAPLVGEREIPQAVAIEIEARLDGSDALHGRKRPVEVVVGEELPGDFQHVGQELAAEESVRIGAVALDFGAEEVLPEEQTLDELLERGREGGVGDGAFGNDDRGREVGEEGLLVLLDEGEGRRNRPFGAEGGENHAVEALLDGVADGASERRRAAGSHFGVRRAENAIDGGEELAVGIARKRVECVEEEEQLGDVGVVREDDDPEEENGLRVRRMAIENVDRDRLVARTAGHRELRGLRVRRTNKRYRRLHDSAMEGRRRSVIRIVGRHSERLAERVERIENNLRELQDNASQHVIEQVHLRLGGTRQQHGEIVDPVQSRDLRKTAESTGADGLVVEGEQNDVQKPHHGLGHIAALAELTNAGLDALIGVVGLAVLLPALIEDRRERLPDLDTLRSAIEAVDRLANVPILLEIETLQIVECLQLAVLQILQLAHFRLLEHLSVQRVEIQTDPHFLCPGFEGIVARGGVGRLRHNVLIRDFWEVLRACRSREKQ